MDRPNILFFFPDQHRYDWTSLNNDLPLETPNYERLCREGTFFKNAVCPSPLCSPSRACMAGGVRYAKTGVINNGQDFSHTFPTNVYKKLRDSGYHVMGCGKFDLRKPSHDHGAEGQHIVDGVNYLKELGFSDGIDNGGKWDGIGTFHRGDKEPYIEFLRERGLLEQHIEDFERRRGDMFRHTFPTTLPDDAYVDNWIADNGFKLLDRAPDDSPWFLQVNFNGPHDPMDITETMEAMVRNKKFPQPTNNTDDWTPREHLATRQNYGAMVENIDARVGDFLDYLEDTDQLDNTLIVYSSDHGEMLGDFDAWAKRLPYHPSIGVPLAIRGPQVKANQRIEAATEVLDVMGTFLDFANVDIDDAMDCKSLRPILEGETDRVREAAYTGLGHWRAILRDQWKMVVGFDPEKKLEIGSPEIHHEPLALYNLAADPWENHNVAGEYPDVVADLSRELPA